MESDSGGTLLVLEPKSLRSFGSQDEYLLAMKEDLADWFSCLHGLHVDADSFLELGIPDVLRFETDDLVLRKNERSVVLCMLELARLGARLGMPAPTIVRMEEEIDAELAGDPPPQIKTCDMKSLDELVSDSVPPVTCLLSTVGCSRARE
ncbi:hypothetical protein C0Q70_08566 [Pomacea canaliculata]|uniref:Uncharacterized protein n=1 Tax=Pomacea canaliculata TaxID=400727 RepID=A0A2T7PI92_POMCA|nr:hypothetical protein C0Q70_08566 [Pomacea canaliculata]